MSPHEAIALFQLKEAATTQGAVAWREAGQGTPLVLLHGIGSASGSWVRQLEAAAQDSLSARVLAWDAPGYGSSAPVAPAQPAAADYADHLWAWLDALGLQRVALVGHSLGALIAAAATRSAPQRVLSLTLLSPAQGYGAAEASVRHTKLADRLQALATHGPSGMAQRRGAAMLSAQALPDDVAYVQATMAQVLPAGYTRAAHMLSNGDLLADLAALRATGQPPMAVASGSVDTITPEAGCRAVAAAAGVDYQTLGAVGHACALEGSAAVNAVLRRALEQPQT